MKIVKTAKNTVLKTFGYPYSNPNCLDQCCITSCKCCPYYQVCEYSSKLPKEIRDENS